MKNLGPLLILLCIGGGVFYFISHKTSAGPTAMLRTATITRGDLLSTINATGTLEPEEIVNVGAQVAGLIVSFGSDPNSPSKHVDYCSIVEQDTVLAEIDPTFYEATKEQAEAALQSAEANLAQYEAKFRYAESEWKRNQALRKSNTVTEAEYDTAFANYETAKANVAVGKATIRQCTAQVKTATINLGYCTIKSPVRGAVIDRRVNVGQTVVASLNAPSLFLIAKDLTKMEVWASVNEADIGRIRLKMPVWFTVDAHEGDTFYGEVTQIRMNAQMTQNVVTYTVVVTTDNSNGKLLPYLTANVHFEVDRRPDVLLIPNAALRWTPDITQLDTAFSEAILEEELPEGTGRLWVADANGRTRPLNVTVGATDGVVTEISGNDVDAGLAVVIGEEEVDSAIGDVGSDTETKNPFLPRPPRGSRPPPGPM